MRLDKDDITIKINKNKILVPVDIQGQRYNFMLDTGSRGTSLSLKNNLSKALNLKLVAKAKYAGANRAFKETNIYRLPEISIGNRLIQNIDVSEDDMPSDDWDGILGMDILAKYALFVDLVDNKLTLSNVPKRLGHQMSIDFIDQKNVLVKVKINGKEYRNFLFDTGAGSTTCTEEIKNETKLTEQRSRAVFMRDTTGNVEKTFMVIAEEFCLEEICKRNFELMPAKYHSLEKKYKRNGILGFDIMMGHKFSLDINSRILFYE